MLSRAVIPLLRQRSTQPILRSAFSIHQTRTYASNRDNWGRVKGESRVQQPQRSNSERESLRRIPRDGELDEAAEVSRQDLEERLQHIADRNSRSSQQPEDSPLKPSPAKPQSSPRQVDEEPEQPLPDLTKGIPSTFAEEIEQTESRPRASKASYNITEDPSGPGTEGIESEPPRDRTPRSEYVSSSDEKKNNAFRYAYLFLGSAVVGYAVYMGRNWETEELEQKHTEVAPSGWGPGLFFKRIRARLGSQVSYYSDPVTTKLLPDMEKDPALQMPYTLVLSLDDLLIHQEWSRAHGWRIAKRPGVDYFLRYLSQYYELVLFTSQPYASVDALLRKFDPYMMIRYPLTREATLYKDGGYIKDISYLNRDLKKVIMIDTDKHHVKNQPENAIVIPKWKGDPKDQGLVQLIPFLEYVAAFGSEDTRTVLKSFDGKEIPAEFARREKLMRERFQARLAERKGGKSGKSSWGVGSLFRSQSPDGLPTADEAEAQGKMLWDVLRERGQRSYVEFEKKIKEEGESWLATREAEEKKLMEEASKNMARGGLWSGWFGGGGPSPETGATSAPATASGDGEKN